MTGVTFGGLERRDALDHSACTRTFARAGERSQEVSLTGSGRRFTGILFRWTDGSAHDQPRGYVKFREVAS